MKRILISILVLSGVFLSQRTSGQETTATARELNQLVLDRKFKEAIQLGKSAVERDSENPYLFYNLGLAYSSLKQYNQACTAFEKSDRLLPGNKTIIMNLADCYCEVSDVVAAEVLIQDLLKTDSTDILVWLQLAQIYQKQSKTDQAIGIYWRLGSEDSTNLWYPRQIGMMLARTEKFKEAIPFLERVVEEDSTDQISYLRLGQAYLNLKAADKIPVLDKAIRQDSMQPLLHRYRGGLELGIGSFAAAEADLKAALELGDTTAFTCRHLGLSQFQQSRYSDAIWSFAKTVELDSLDTEAWYYLGFCYKWTEDIPKAIDCLLHALKIAIPPSTASIFSGLGLFYNLQSDFKTSMVYYKKSLEYNPDDAYPYSQLGLLVEQTSRDLETAKGYYERFLREYDGPDQNLMTYVVYRLQLINEKLFMEGKLKKQ